MPPNVCVPQTLIEKFSAALGTGWNLTAGHLFPVVELIGARRTAAPAAAAITTAFHVHLARHGTV